MYVSVLSINRLRKYFLFCKSHILLKIYFVPSRKANFESIYKHYVFTYITYN